MREASPGFFLPMSSDYLFQAIFRLYVNDGVALLLFDKTTFDKITNRDEKVSGNKVCALFSDTG